MVISVIGAGGKTTLVHQLKDMYLAKGYSVLVTTTTHMMREDDTLVCDEASSIIDCIEKNGYCMAGTPAADGKISKLSEAVYEKVCEHADIVLVEADGSKHMPLKYPAKWEPVIPSNTDKIIVVAGLNSLGKTSRETVFRLDLACENTAITEDTIITPIHIQELIRKGYIEPMKNTHSNIETDIHPMQADTLYKRVVAEFLKENKDVSVIDENWFAPCGELIICGGGHVSKYVAQMAKLIDFKITVIDDREEFVNKERFPEADRLICCDYEDIKNNLPNAANACYVVVTRGHMADQTCVEAILEKDYLYLGMIGSRKKIATVMENLAQSGFTKEQRDSIHAPIGLPIGARTPAEIAVSILAEIIQIKNSHNISTMTDELAKSTEKGTLCIIIDKSGSSPRGIGSMMLVTKDGIIGSIGGGLVEKYSIDYAKNVTEICEKEYILTNEESAGMGMICGGKNKVLFIPLS